MTIQPELRALLGRAAYNLELAYGDMPTIRDIRDLLATDQFGDVTNKAESPEVKEFIGDLLSINTLEKVITEAETAPGEFCMKKAPIVRVPDNLNKTREQWQLIDPKLCVNINSPAANMYLIRDAKNDIESLHRAIFTASQSEQTDVVARVDALKDIEQSSSSSRIRRVAKEALSTYRAAQAKAGGL